jgi:alkaline phosphatase D
LSDDDRYKVKDIGRLARSARQAFIEHMPLRVGSAREPRIFRRIDYGPLVEVFALDLRSYRAANSGNRQTTPGRATALAGERQIEWLEQALVTSSAVWKVISSDLPIGLVIRDGESAFESFGNGDGPPLGRELELVRLFRFIQRRNIRNVVWVTADVHYAAAHHYDPARARFREFLPFWEFVAGPLHAATGARIPLDQTFGPEVRFVAVPEPLPALNGPASGLQFFGTVRVDGRTSLLTVRLHNLAGDVIYSVDVEPAG